MPPPSAGSFLSICCRCQLRALRRTNPARTQLRSTSQAAFTGTNDNASPAVEDKKAPRTKSGQALIVLGPPKARKNPTVDGLRKAVTQLEEKDLQELSKNILIYEKEVVLDAIGLLQPSEPRVSKERWQQLYDQLNNQFNGKQLRNFFNNSPGTIAKVGVKATKMQTIKLILGDLWKVEIAQDIAEREDVIVEEQIKSNKRDIFLLIAEDGRVLREWAQKCNARITVNVAESTLKINASRASIETIQGLLETLLSQIKTETIDISAAIRIAEFPDDVIPVIARMTNTFIERLGDFKISISSADETRDRMEDARRLILTSINLSLRTKNSLLFNPPLDNNTTGALFPFSESSSLPWSERHQNWGRWKLITQRPFPGTQKPKLVIDSFNILRNVNGSRGSTEIVFNSLSKLGGPTPTSEMAEHGLKSTYEATIGNLLYCIPTDDYAIRVEDPELEVPEFIRRFHDAPRILSNSFPGIHAFTQDPLKRADFTMPAPPLRNASSKEYFQLRFLPTPWANPDNFETYPPVRLTVKIDPTTGEPLDPEFHALSLQCNADVLLPRLPCDIRFTRRDEAALPISEDAQAAGIAKDEWERYLANSQLNPTKNSKLRSASEVKLNIPNWLVNGPAKPAIEDAEASEASETSEVSTESTLVEYTFAGMEFRREVTLDDKGYSLSRTVVEGGVSGGRKTEIKMTYNPGTKKEVEQEGFKAFVDKAISFGNGVDLFLRSKLGA
ncbi:mitochondrial inner-membrane-bound regulator-domain-containing protein [Pyronema omphalodes]|nr:mitochondrial inner-membrane-bound regulator-domain-containing protein [Pyronema omphalodes]